MLRLAVPFILLLLSLFGGAVWLLDSSPSPQAPDEQARTEKPADASSTKEAAARATDDIKELQDSLAPTKRDGDDAPAFDIARIDPEGTSVFAGRAEPNTRITVTADGQEIGTAEVDENGEWTLTTETRIANPDAKLALFKAARSEQHAAAERATANSAASGTADGASSADAATPPSPNKITDSEAAAGNTPPSGEGVDEPKPKSAGAVTANMLKDLEGMVAEARSEAQQSTEAGAPAAGTAPKTAQQQLANIPQTPQQFADAPPQQLGETHAPVDGEAAAAAAPASTPHQHSAATLPAPVTPPSAPPPGSAQLPPAAQTATPSISVPVPVTFVYNEATLTSEGNRAASLLLEYLRIKRFPKITLTGHADERGTNELNMNLSRERLETVARFLREGGYTGQLELIPKGKTEPYLGVVRGDFSQEDLWQLDRRVELVVSR